MTLNQTPSNGQKLWNYYNKCLGLDGEFLEKAQCALCKKYYIYKSSDNAGSLWRHLRTVHNIERQYNTEKAKRRTHKHLPPVPEKDISEIHTEIGNTTANLPDYQDNTANLPVLQHNTANLPIYRYFTLCNNSRVKCRVCMSASIPTPLIPNHASNMKVHLKTHPRAYKLYELEKEFGSKGPEYDEKEHLPKNQSNILIQDSDGKYYCRICKKTMSGGITEMHHHLAEKHAHLSKREIGQDSIYTEVVFVGNKEKKRPISKLNLKPAKKANVTNLTGKEDLDAFGFYVTSLLRKMPQEDCTKVQQTILNNIIEAKLKSGNKKSKVTEEVDDIENIADNSRDVETIVEEEVM